MLYDDKFANFLVWRCYILYIIQRTRCIAAIEAIISSHLQWTTLFCTIMQPGPLSIWQALKLSSTSPSSPPPPPLTTGPEAFSRSAFHFTSSTSSSHSASPAINDDHSEQQCRKSRTKTLPSTVAHFSDVTSQSAASQYQRVKETANTVVWPTSFNLSQPQSSLSSQPPPISPITAHAALLGNPNSTIHLQHSSDRQQLEKRLLRGSVSTAAPAAASLAVTGTGGQHVHSHHHHDDRNNTTASTLLTASLAGAHERAANEALILRDLKPVVTGAVKKETSSGSTSSQQHQSNVLVRSSTMDYLDQLRENKRIITQQQTPIISHQKTNHNARPDKVTPFLHHIFHLSFYNKENDAQTQSPIGDFVNNFWISLAAVNYITRHHLSRHIDLYLDWVEIFARCWIEFGDGDS